METDLAKRVLAWLFYLMKKRRGRETAKQLLKYAFVGLVSNTVGYMIYLLITYLGVAPKLAMSVLYSVGAAIGFLGNSNLTFSYTGGIMVSGIRYLLAHCVGYLINLTLLVVFVDGLGFAHQVVQAAAVLVVAAFLFLAYKFFVFRPTKARRQ